MADLIDPSELAGVIEAAIRAATDYRAITGKPLGITGEVGEYLAAKLLDLQLTDARQPGYDAVAPDGRRIQIKARCILPGSGPGQRLGSIRLDHDWETVALILMDGMFAPLAIYEALRIDVERELMRPGSIARNVRGSLPVSKFKSISTRVWWPEA